MLKILFKESYPKVSTKKYPQKDIEDALKDFTVKIDGNSIFVEKD